MISYLLLEVLVTAGAHDVLEVVGLVWVRPPVIVWSGVHQMSIVVVRVVFVSDGVSENSLWNTTACLLHSPVTAVGATAMGEVRIPDLDALAETTDAIVILVIARWSQITFDAVLSVQVDGQGVARQEHLILTRGPVSRLTGVEQNLVEHSVDDFGVGSFGLVFLAIPVLLNLVWSETNDLLDVVVGQMEWEAFEDLFHFAGDFLLQRWDLIVNSLFHAGMDRLDQHLAIGHFINPLLSRGTTGLQDGPRPFNGDVLVAGEAILGGGSSQPVLQCSNFGDHGGLQSGNFVDNGCT
jgi:hypothetical protein